MKITAKSSIQFFYSSSGGPVRPRMLFVCLLLLTGTALTPIHALAQVRLLDRIGRPTSQSIWDQAQQNLRSGSVKIDGHVHKRQFPASDLAQHLTLPHWSSSFNLQNTTYRFTVVGSDPALGTTTVRSRPSLFLTG